MPGVWSAGRLAGRSGAVSAAAAAVLLSAGGVQAGPVPGAWSTADLRTRASAVSAEAVMPVDVMRPVRVVPVRVDCAWPVERVLRTSVEGEGVLEIVEPARVLAGETTGYALVRVVGAGEGVLRMGGAAVRVRVNERSAAPEGVMGLSPRVLTPAGGAAVWGVVHVGACVWREPDAGAPALRLRVGEGDSAQELSPVWMSAAESGPLMLASFAVDFDTMPRGSASLRVVRTDGAGRVHESEAARVRVIRPAESAVITGECETDYGLLGPKTVGPPKPPPSQKDAEASGGRFFPNAGADPKFRFPVDVPSEQGAGWYQVMLVAAGDAGAGTLPTVAVNIDESQRATTSAAIAQPGWHRVPVGVAVKLEAGRHVLRCDFANDFSVRGSDRNLRLDRIEVARVSDAGAGVKEGAEADLGGEMMAGGAGMMSKGVAEEMASNALTSPEGGLIGGTMEGGTRDVRIAFERPIDGLEVMGEAEVRGAVWWANAKGSPPPRVSLLINGRVAASQVSDGPRFVVPTDWWRPGENTVQMAAEGASGGASGGVVRTCVQRVNWGGTGAERMTGARESVRITVHDPAMDGRVRRTLKEGQGGEQKLSASVAASSRVAVSLPAGMSGEFDVWVEGRASGSKGQRVDVSVIEGEGEGAALPAARGPSREIPTWMGVHGLTERGAGLRLRAGPKTLVIDVPEGEKWTPGKGEKAALWLQAVRLVERPAAETARTVRIDWPGEGEGVFGADAVVASVRGDAAWRTAEVVIDGAGTGMVFDIARGTAGLGRVTAPLILRGVSAGEHTVGLRVTDAHGGTVESDARRVRVLAERPEGGTAYERAVGVLNRMAFGPDERELAAILTEGPRAYVASRLTSGEDAREAAAEELGRVRFVNARSAYDVSRRAIQQAIATGNPVRDRLVLWAENHFSTWIRKDEAWRKSDEHDAFSALGAATMYELLRTSATSPAMLRYLDQERSYAGKLNENYAREIMELHTLGVHGGYSQQDVTNLAHVLTGWTTARQALAAVPESTPDDDGLADEFRYEPAAAARLEEPRVVLGRRFGATDAGERHERVLLALEMLSSHPSTARFVCGKLAAHYAGAPAPEAMVDEMASTFLRTGGDMREVLLTMVESTEFARSAVERPRVAHALDYGVRLCRAAGWNAPWDVGDCLDRSGQGLFDRPTPDGYPEVDTEAMDSNAMLQRWRLASKGDSALADLVPGAMRYSEAPIDEREARRIVDVIAVRLTGGLLNEASTAAAVEMLMGTEPVLPARPEQMSRDGRVRTVAAFVAQLPEAQVR